MANIELTVTSGGGLAVTPAPSLALTVGQPAPALDLTAGPVVSLPEGLATDDAVNAARDALLAALAQMPPPDVSSLATGESLAAAQQALTALLSLSNQGLFEQLMSVRSDLAALPAPATPADLAPLATASAVNAARDSINTFVNAQISYLRTQVTARPDTNTIQLMLDNGLLNVARSRDLFDYRNQILDSINSFRTAEQAGQAQLLTALSTAGAQPYEIRQFYNPAGVLPAGWTQVGGPTPPVSFGNTRIALCSRDPSGVSALNTSAVLSVVVANSAYTMTSGGNWSVYSATADGWSTTPAVLAAAKTAGTAPLLGVASGTKIYCWGVNNAPGLWVYDTVADTFTAGASSASPYMQLGCALADGRILLAGGSISTSATATSVLTTVQLYSPLSNTYTTRASLPVRAAKLVGSLLLSSGKVILFAAFTSDSVTLKTGQCVPFVYDPVADSWQQLDAVDTAAATNGIAAAWENADGTVTVLPAYVPSGPAARTYTLTAAAGAQLTQVNYTMPGVHPVAWCFSPGSPFGRLATGDTLVRLRSANTGTGAAAFAFGLLKTGGQVTSAGPVYAYKN